MKSNYLSLLLLLALSIVVISCNDDDHDHDDNTITITIQNPTAGATISDCASVLVQVEVEASIENHELEIVLHPEDDTSNRIIDFDKHDHDQLITFEETVDLCSFAAGTCFHLEVVACEDHDCEKTARADAEFCLQ